uniref:Uncharacterized protein n=1 Tax=Octopus bimaculoides TaxID=37653 RepID=A0A0L8HGC3_OCTBM
MANMIFSGINGYVRSVKTDYIELQQFYILKHVSIIAILTLLPRHLPIKQLVSNFLMCSLLSMLVFLLV